MTRAYTKAKANTVRQHAGTLCCEGLVLIPDEVKQHGMISGGPGDKEGTNQKTPVRGTSILNGRDHLGQ